MLLRLLIQGFIFILSLISACSSASEVFPELPIRLLGDTEMYSIVNNPEYVADEASMIHIWDSILTHSQPKLIPTYQHMSLTRAWVELTKYPNACMINIIKNTKREAIAEFADYPFSIFPPVRLIALAKNQHKFSPPFSLQNLKNSNLRVGIAKSRSYGIEVDKFIAENPEYFFVRGSESSMSKIIDMLLKERVDAIIDFSQIVLGHQQDTAQLQPIVSIPLQEAAEPVFSYAACANTPTGKAIIAAINQSYQHPEVQQTLQTFHRYYFGEQEYRLLAPYLDKLFIDNHSSNAQKLKP